MSFDSSKAKPKNYMDEVGVISSGKILGASKPWMMWLEASFLSAPHFSICQPLPTPFIPSMQRP